MPSTFFGLNIAVSGMQTYNAGLTTTGHNISNVKTVGYSRQTVEQSAKDAVSLKTSYGMLGAGVNATDILSSRDAFYDYKYRMNNSVLGKYEVQSEYLSNIENYFYPEDKNVGSMPNSLDDFFTALSYLTTSSQDETIRAEVTGSADTLAYYTRDVAIKLQRLQSEVNIEIEATVNQINTYATQIASLNKQINMIEVYGTRANDLRDQRAVVLDKLSELADITVTEKIPEDGNGVTQFIVTLGGGILVDTYRFNTIHVTTNDEKVTQNDADNLYDVEWSYGQKFNTHSTILGGKLQGLFEIRDGNNAENFKATLVDAKAGVADSNDPPTLTLKSDQFSSDNASNLARLNLPATDGVLTVGNVEYAYKSFSVEIAADGTYTYTFELKEDLSENAVDRLEEIMASDDQELKMASAGDSIAFRGIPYYMMQLNEFIRTFSANFNELQNKGYDYNGNLGQDLFMASNVTSGATYDMTEFLKSSSDGFYYLNGLKVFDTNKKADYENQGYTFDAIAGEPDYYNLLDKDGTVVEKVYVQDDADDPIFTFDSVAVEGEKACYYAMTAMNVQANQEIVSDSRLLACSATHVEGVSGWEEHENLEKMNKLRDDNTMFKQGTPGSYINVMTTAVLGVDSRQAGSAAVNAQNILNEVDNRRTSIMGVDEDEEGQNLIIYQNLLTYQYRVLSIMNEVLDKLINGTAI